MNFGSGVLGHNKWSCLVGKLTTLGKRRFIVSHMSDFKMEIRDCVRIGDLEPIHLELEGGEEFAVSRHGNGGTNRCAGVNSVIHRTNGIGHYRKCARRKCL